MKKQGNSKKIIPKTETEKINGHPGMKQHSIHKTYILAILLVFSAIPESFSQILNVEKNRFDKDTSNYFLGNISFSMNLFNRNAGKNTPTNFLTLSAAADVAYMSHKHLYLLINNFNYTVVKDAPALVKTGYSHFRINFMHRQKLSYESFAQSQYDIGRGLELRMLGGAGLRYAIYKSKGINFYAGTGLMYEHEEWHNPEVKGTLIVKNLVKSTNYLSTRARINEYVDINAITYYQTGYDPSISAFRPRISGEINATLKVNSKLRFRINFNCNYDRRPIVPITHFIYSMNNGIQYNF